MPSNIDDPVHLYHKAPYKHGGATNVRMCDARESQSVRDIPVMDYKTREYLKKRVTKESEICIHCRKSATD